MTAHVLSVALVESIRTLFAQGWSRRRITRELGVDTAYTCRDNFTKAVLSIPQRCKFLLRHLFPQI
jgi:hypothetical protein